MTKPALIIFIRNPELGKVKTRLARDVGQEKALAIYKALLTHTRDTALAVDAQRLLFYSQAIQTDDDWPTPAFTKLLQSGGDLGERMQLAFAQALERSGKAVIVGSDIAQIKAGIINEAFEALDKKDYVIGPAIDGGYYLLGMKQPTPELFQDMEWSTPNVCQTTLDRIASLGRSCQQVATLSDIDYAEDWERYGWSI
jgi:rSAM/selenodomain-associated transferase 1